MTILITSQQSAIEASDIRENYNLKTDKAVDDMLFLKTDVKSIVDLINNGFFTPSQGIGSPEGTIESNASLQYIDAALSPVSVTMWVNTIIGSDTGWVQVV